MQAGAGCANLAQSPPNPTPEVPVVALILPYEKALAVILEAVEPVPAETASVRECLGRVAAEDLVVPNAMPDLPRSAVDGFAYRGEGDAPRRLVGEVRAGALPDSPLQPDEAVAIMTGAVVPVGADRVAMLEHCRLDGETLHPPGSTPPASGINPVGSEALPGDTFITAGTHLGPGVYATLFAAGLTQVPAHRRVRLGLLISGDEVREVEDGPAPGQVFNSNRYVVEAVGRALGVEMGPALSVGDDPAAIRMALATLTEQCDVVVTSGGVSRGRHDHLGAILSGEGHQLLIKGSSIKPGRPLHVARSTAGPLVLALPGYPAALLTNTFLYLVPALKKMAGRGDHRTRWFPVTLTDPQRGRPGRTTLNRVILKHAQGRWTAADPGTQLTSHFLAFGRCDGLVRMPRSQPDHSGLGAFTLPRGTVVPALHFGWELA